MPARRGQEGLSAIVAELAARLRALEARDRAEISGGVASYTVIGLPTPGQGGRHAFATNGRKTGEGPGAGTGVLCYDDGVQWRAVDTGLQVQA